MKLFALLTCDSVTIDQATGKHFILGHFSSIKVGAFPASHPSLTLFIGMTDIAAGEHTLELKYGLPNATPPPAPKKAFPWDPPPPPPPDPMRVILTQKMTSKGSGEKLYLISELKDLPFEKAANYLLQVNIDGAIAGSVELSVAK